MKKFQKASLQRIDYLSDIGEDAFHDVLYSLKETHYSFGRILQKPNDDITDLLIL